MKTSRRNQVVLIQALLPMKMDPSCRLIHIPAVSSGNTSAAMRRTGEHQETMGRIQQAQTTRFLRKLITWWALKIMTDNPKSLASIGTAKKLAALALLGARGAIWAGPTKVLPVGSHNGEPPSMAATKSSPLESSVN